MGLSEDQKALLRLLAKREEGYEDIAALKGLSVEQVRAEVNEALAELEATEEPSAPPVPSPPPEPMPMPEPQEQGVAVPAPAVAAPPEPRRPQGAARPSLPAERRRLVLLAAGALAAVAVVLGAVALIGGGSGSDSDDPIGTSTEAAAAESDKVTQAVLSAADGSDASGRAVFGRVGKEEIVLQVTAENLEPTDDGQSYTVWLYRTPKLTLRVGSAAVGEDGRLGAQFPIPAELLAYVASGAFNQIYLSRTDDAAYRREVAQAQREKSLPRYTGETVLTGEIIGPILKAR
jgi:hypothetical protein